jgi:hypothetical protein
MNEQTGIIGFFDVLGYQNLLEKNEPKDVLEKIIPVFNSLDKKVREAIEAFKENEGREFALDVFKNMKWLVFSDTILSTLSNHTPLESRDWLIFILTSRVIFDHMFECGLPVRGVIEHGSFLIQDHFFAGRSIVSAYQLTNKLNLSACVFSKNAVEEREKVLNVMDSLIRDYYTQKAYTK